MKWLIWTIRSWSCDHEWLYEEGVFKTLYVDYNQTTSKTRISATCSKCGWHRKYDKF